MTTPAIETVGGTSPRLRVLFVVALLGVLAALTAMAGVLLGGAAAAVVGVVLTGLLLAVAGRARRAQQHAARRASGHTCSCCATSQFDGVRVV